MEKQKSILVIAESLRINTTSSGIVSSTHIKLLQEAGYQVDVLTENNFDYQVNWLPENVNVHKFNIKYSPLNILDKIYKVKAYHAYIFDHNKTNTDVISSYKEQIFKLLDKKNYDYIYLLGTGSSFLPYFVFPSKKINIPYIVNIHDPFPMHLYPEPYKKKATFLYKKLAKNFNKVLEGAHKITLPSQYLLDDLAKTFPVLKQKALVIPHIGTELKNLTSSALDNKVTLNPNKVNIIHAGNLLGPRNPKYLIQAINELNSENIDFENEVLFTFFGNFSKEHEQVIKQTNSKNIEFNQTRVSYKKSKELMLQADANLVIEAISNFSPFLPGKVSDIVFAGKPIIALTPSISEVNRVLGNNYSYTTKLDDIENIKKVLLQFYTDFKNKNIDLKPIENLKSYVSISQNGKIINSFLK